MSENKNSQYINISFLTVAKIMIALVVFLLLYIVRDILAILFISLVLSSALDPWVDWLQEKKIPRSVSVISIYLAMVVVISFAIYLVIPPITTQVVEFTNNYPNITEKVVVGFNSFKEYSLSDNPFQGYIDSQEKIPGFTKAAGNIVSSIFSIFGGIFTFFLILVITFYMVVEEDAIKKVIWSLAPSKKQIYIMKLVTRMQKKIGLWLRGQIILSFIIFLLTYIGLSILGVEYALILAIIAGLTEFIPYLGPMIAAIPAMFLAFTQGGPIFMGMVGALYYIIQLVENNIITPKLMQKVVGLNPIITIAVLMIGFKLGGIVGMIISIPVTTALNVFLKDVFEKKAFKND